MEGWKWKKEAVVGPNLERPTFDVANVESCCEAHDEDKDSVNDDLDLLLEIVDFGGVEDVQDLINLKRYDAG